METMRDGCERGDEVRVCEVALKASARCGGALIPPRLRLMGLPVPFVLEPVAIIDCGLWIGLAEALDGDAVDGRVCGVDCVAGLAGATMDSKASKSFPVKEAGLVFGASVNLCASGCVSGGLCTCDSFDGRGGVCVAPLDGGRDGGREATFFTSWGFGLELGLMNASNIAMSSCLRPLERVPTVDMGLDGGCEVGRELTKASKASKSDEAGGVGAGWNVG